MRACPETLKTFLMDGEHPSCCLVEGHSGPHITEPGKLGIRNSLQWEVSDTSLRTSSYQGPWPPANKLT